MHIDAISAKSVKEKQNQKMAEIEKFKKRREESSTQKRIGNVRERDENQDWEKKKEKFEYEQRRIRSEIRLRQGHPKRIDVLFKHLNNSDAEGLAVKDMEELREDIVMHLDLDRAMPRHIAYWEALLVVCNWELSEARKRDALDQARVRGEEPPAEFLAEQRGLHASIEADVRNLLHGRTCKELEVLQAHIESCAVLKQLHVFKGMACLKHLYRPQNPGMTENNLASEYDVPKPQVEEDIMHGIEHVSPYCPKPKTEDGVHQFGEEHGPFSPELLHTKQQLTLIWIEMNQNVNVRQSKNITKEEFKKRWNQNQLPGMSGD
ncbi:hypothetical protein MKX01_018626 [Papaver californicum]|nr:hypothetical protein MKX01_018626 [Papaver californicum]